MRLIISEKDIAAKRISQILAGAGGVKEGKSGSVPTYTFDSAAGPTQAVGLKGHILKVDFPPEYSNWQKIEPAELVDAKIVKVPTQKPIISALKKLAKDADEIVVATDFDREGELIGADAVNLVREVNKDAPVKRARFSALTPDEINRAFTNLEEPYLDLARAGEARQDIDLVWGATLTRFISLASKRFGKNFLSVGRVQSPTLALVVAREKERQAFQAEPYRVVKAVFARRVDGEEEFTAQHKTEKFWDRAEADAVVAKLGDSGQVSKLARTAKKSPPPPPFNTTAFIAAASSIGVSASSAMRVAESLYMDGLISYPRVDNTVYPPSLDLRGLLQTISGNSRFGHLAQRLAALPELTPTRGKKEATDHPPIHPTALAEPGRFKAGEGSREWKIYELVCRRFMATLAPAAVQESTRIDIDAAGEPFFVRGTVVKEPGWLEYYPYSRKKDEEVPALEEGEELRLVRPETEDKETQPPGRYGQSKLIQEMEKLGLGTKSTRHEIIKNLYDRGYVYGDPIVPTEMGIAVADALRKYAERIATPEMTAELERDMDAIAEGQTDRATVVDHSRTMLAGIMLELKKKETEVGDEIWNGIREDAILGTCPNCGKELRVIRSKKTKKRFVGCSGYPDCNRTYPLPQFGQIQHTGAICADCQTPKIKVVSKGKRPWELCLDPDCPTKAKKGPGKGAKKES